MVTPTEKYPDLAAALELPEVFFKREDIHPYGSHKGRSIPHMIDHYASQEDRRFVISSSGNAALAAALYVQELNSSKKYSPALELDIYIGSHAAAHKVEKLKKVAEQDATQNGGEARIRVLLKERPRQALLQATQDGMRSLRQSTDNVALVGYETLAKELAETKAVGALFIGTSSGTTAQALADYFLKNKVPIQVHIVQTSSCHPMTDDLENYDGPDELSLADAITDNIAIRKPILLELIKKTGGYGWVASNEDIITAQKLVRTHTGLEISTNSALSVVGAMQAAYRKWDIKGAVVCLVCGD